MGNILSALDINEDNNRMIRFNQRITQQYIRLERRDILQNRFEDEYKLVQNSKYYTTLFTPNPNGPEIAEYNDVGLTTVATQHIDQTIKKLFDQQTKQHRELLEEIKSLKRLW